MKKGTDVPIEATPPDRLELARQIHAQAVQAYQTAQRAYVEEVNAMPLPALMRGGKVRVTDLDSRAEIIATAREAAGTTAQSDRMVADVLNYRDERSAVAKRHDLGRLAEAVVDAAAEMIRLGGEA